MYRSERKTFIYFFYPDMKVLPDNCLLHPLLPFAFLVGLGRELSRNMILFSNVTSHIRFEILQYLANILDYWSPGITG